MRLQEFKMAKFKLLLVLISFPSSIFCQANYGQDPANTNAANKIYYFDSNSDCNGPIRELLGFEATIRGNDISSTRLGPRSCSIILRSTGQFEGTVLDIEVKAMNIIDCTTRVSIFDGNGPQIALMSYDCYSNFNMNKKRFFTTGDTATFVMERENINSFNFDIEIKVNPVRAGTAPGYENSYGKGYFFDKFPQTTIVAMIGGFYALIALVCTIIVIHLSRKFYKQDKDWETHQLSTLKAGSTFDVKSQPSYAWSVDMKQSQGPGSQYSRSSADPYPRKTATARGVDNVVFKNDAVQNQRLMNDRKDTSRPRYASNDTSFTEPEEDDHFVERIITSRVKMRNKQPPSYDRAVSDHISEHSSDEDTEVTSSDYSVKKQPLSSEGSETSRSSGTVSETVSQDGSDSDGHSSCEREPRPRRQKRKPPKSRRRELREDDDEGASSKSGHQQVPSQQKQQQAQLQMQQVQYGAYPPGQFIPMMAYPSQLQPGVMMPPYIPSGYLEQQSAPPPSQPEVEPTEPPVYSYLVRRGYTPLDMHSNPPGSIVGGQRSGGMQLRDSELRLDSGIEYMKR